MNKLLFMASVLMIFFGCKADESMAEKEKTQKTNNFAIIIHGGAGTILKKICLMKKKASTKQS